MTLEPRMRQLALIGLAGVLGVAVMAGIAAGLGRMRRHAPDAVPETGPAFSAPAASASAEEPAALLARRERQHDQAARGGWTRDPFLRGPAVIGVIGLTLSGIIWDQVAPLAIINGEVLQPGQDIEGYRLLEIHPDRVWLSDGTELFQLLLSR